ncbi:adenosylcobinamide amidohydrolase [Oligoflexus tunisiensis]|uniref:adenosylcobinamide amidohydrolase n=1 Tax=Oligoflexus tunisiensis TaxID=708132 RepID=UPI00114CAE42|nr:adenosylcobinamide amidohydrolase [Oligoflexus tunisiensis]
MKRDASILIHRGPGETQPHLLWTLPEPMKTLSWALHGGGIHVAQKIAWIQVGPYDLTRDTCPRNFLQQKLKNIGADDALGLMTSAKIEHYTRVVATVGGITATAVATVGLGNALRAGDPSRTGAPVGTINCVCLVDHALSLEAMLEALVISAEAKTAAVLESGLRSAMSGLPATGTGTDCHVIACPDRESVSPYAGKHTDVGSAIGASVFTAVQKGVQRWMQLHPDHPLALDRFQAAMK